MYFFIFLEFFICKIRKIFFCIFVKNIVCLKICWKLILFNVVFMFLISKNVLDDVK